MAGTLDLKSNAQSKSKTKSLKRTKPPFRADQVGSLLRPKRLREAREHRENGAITLAELRAVEDEAIRDVVRLQEEVGLQGVTDGEFRREYFHLDFLKRIDGIEVEPTGVASKFRRDDGVDVNFAPPKLKVSGKLKRSAPIAVDDFRFLKSATTRTAKAMIPSPSMAHFRGGRGAIDNAAYPDLEEFFADLAAVYRAEVADLAAAGCRYLQLDDTNLAYLCDHEMREGAKARGEDPDALPLTYAQLINDSLRGRPNDMAVGVHLCRGNFRSAWAAEGGYEPVAEAMFNETDVDAFFLEYDDARSGGFEPLRFVPKGKYVVLGLVCSKTAKLESKDDLKRRIEEASRHLDLDQLCLSPQCGFASTVHGNDINEDIQRRKLALVVETADEVWG
jgi:5-methyltetrahydropteroyltriglutamate--homocysteine methyltransferase